MEFTSTASLAGAAALITLISLTARKARTAPAAYITAMLGALGMMVFLLSNGLDADGYTRMITLGSAAALGTGMIVGVILIGNPAALGTYVPDGADLAAIKRACKAAGNAEAKIEAFTMNRRNMSLTQRLRDAFVTTPEEGARIEAIKVIVGVTRHLEKIVPEWLRARTDALIDKSIDRREISAIEARLRPLEKIEQRAGELHSLAVQATRSIEEAIIDLDGAKVYEVADAVSADKALAVMSSVANSEARTSVQNVIKAIDALNEKTQEAVDCGIIMPDDMLDLVFDMTLDSPLDIISFINIGKLENARQQCESTRNRISWIESELRAKHAAVQMNCETLRKAIQAIRQPYSEKASQELPHFARTFAPGVD